MQSSTEHPQLAETIKKIDALQSALLANDPKIGDHLRAIHSHLSRFEEVTHLLPEEQITVLMDAAQRKLGLILAAETTKTKGSGGKSLKGVTADDL